MSATSDAFLRKAHESLTGAASEHANHRDNNAASRMYYACFQAAIAALENESIRPQSGKQEWSHTFVQAQFSGLLIARRKRYPSQFRDLLNEMILLRQEADYRPSAVSRTRTTRLLSRATAFVAAVTEREQGGNS